MLRGHDDRHLVEALVDRGIEPDIFADLLQAIGQFGTAEHWGSQYEWYAHAPLALKAGLDPSIVAAIGAGRKPETMKDDEAIVWEFTTQLRRDHAVDDETYAKALDKFGEQGVTDLIAVNGYYDVVSMTLNVARVMPPEGEVMPFKQAGR